MVVCPPKHLRGGRGGRNGCCCSSSRLCVRTSVHLIHTYVVQYTAMVVVLLLLLSSQYWFCPRRREERGVIETWLGGWSAMEGVRLRESCPSQEEHTHASSSSFVFSSQRKVLKFAFSAVGPIHAVVCTVYSSRDFSNARKEIEIRENRNNKEGLLAVVSHQKAHVTLP